MSLRIGVVMGGLSSEHDISLLSGAAVIDATQDTPDDWIPILWRLDGRWEIPAGDSPRPFDVAFAALRTFDVLFLALHGRWGEDGRVQATLDLMGLPYTGSGVTASALAMDKVLAKRVARDLGISTPREVVIRRSESPSFGRIGEELGFPCVVKPVDFGSSDDTDIVDDVDALAEHALAVAERHGRAMIEEWIEGLELTGAVREDPITGNAVALPIVEIHPGEGHRFFDRDVKYAPDESTEICPARIDPLLEERVRADSIRLHEAFGCRGFSRSDFIVRASESVYLETNTIPGLTRESLLPKSARATGLSLEEFFTGLVTCARRSHG